MLAAFAGPAGAADFDSTGVVRTSSGATAIVEMRCGLSYGSLSLNFGATRPNYFAVRIANANTNTWATNWTAWQAVTAQNMYVDSLITLAGNWNVAIQIAHWNGRAWTYDTEYTYVTNLTFGYASAAYCHVGR